MKKQVYVLEVTKSKLLLYSVSLADTTKAELLKSVAIDFFAHPLDQKIIQHTVSNLFSEINNKPQTIRMLLAEQFAYATHVAIPLTTQKNKERELVLNELKKIVPDTIAEGDWDYKIETQIDNNTTQAKDPQQNVVKKALAFVPVSRFFQPLTQATLSLGITIEAVESVSLAHERDVNPVIGIALKQDLRGKDATILNIQKKDVSPGFGLISSNSMTNDNKVTQEPGLSTVIQNSTGVKMELHSSDTKSKVISKYGPVIGAVITLILIVATAVYSVGTFLLQQGSLDTLLNQQPQENSNLANQKLDTTESVEVITSEEQFLLNDDVMTNLNESTQSSELQLSFNPKEVSVRVLNASGISGAATQIKIELEKKGFKDITVGNSTGGTSAGFGISIKESLAQTNAREYITQSLATILTDLPDRLFVLDESIKVDDSYLSNTSEFDLLIVVGK